MNVLVSKQKFVIIDIIDSTGLTRINKQPIDAYTNRYPDAEIMKLDVWINWKAEREPSIEWKLTIEECYNEALEVMPPSYRDGTWFLVGEPSDHDLRTGLPRYYGYRRIAEAFETTNRPITNQELEDEYSRACCTSN